MEEQETKVKSVDELHSVLMQAKEVVVLDIETTGYTPNAHAEILQIGAVLVNVDTRKKIKTFSCFVKPSDRCSVPKKITELTGITWDDVKDRHYMEEVLPNLAAFIGHRPVVAHNAAFDWYRFLLPGFINVGIHMKNPCICTMLLAKNLFPKRGKNGYNLESLCSMYGCKITGHHNALADAKHTAALFVHLLETYREKNKDKPTEPILIQHHQFADLSRMYIRQVSFYKGPSKKLGPSIYVLTSFGKVCFSVRRHLWKCVQLFTDTDVPIYAWGHEILRQLEKTEDEFVKSYTDYLSADNKEGD